MVAKKFQHFFAKRFFLFAGNPNFKIEKMNKVKEIQKLVIQNIFVLLNSSLIGEVIRFQCAIYFTSDLQRMTLQRLLYGLFTVCFRIFKISCKCKFYFQVVFTFSSFVLHPVCNLLHLRHGELFSILKICNFPFAMNIMVSWFRSFLFNLYKLINC